MCEEAPSRIKGLGRTLFTSLFSNTSRSFHIREESARFETRELCFTFRWIVAFHAKVLPATAKYCVSFLHHVAVFECDKVTEPRTSVPRIPCEISSKISFSLHCEDRAFLLLLCVLFDFEICLASNGQPYHV